MCLRLQGANIHLDSLTEMMCSVLLPHQHACNYSGMCAPLHDRAIQQLPQGISAEPAEWQRSLLLLLLFFPHSPCLFQQCHTGHLTAGLLTGVQLMDE